MKNIILICFLSLIRFNCFCQTKIQVTLSDTIAYNLEYSRNLFISTHVDSLNNYKVGNLPFFLANYDFDYNNSIYWDGYHQANCLRKMIFEKVNNKKLLKAIIKSKNKNYKKTSDMMLQIYYETKIPYQEISNLDFAKERLKALKHK